MSRSEAAAARALVHIGANVALDADAVAARIERRVRLPAGARLTPTGIVGLPPMPAKRLVGLTCRLLRGFSETCYEAQVYLFAIGDAVDAGETQWGDTYTILMGATGYAYKTIANAVWVARKVDFSVRRENLSWRHHEVVAAREPEEQEYWLARAEDEGLSTRELAAAIREEDDLNDGKDPAVAAAERALAAAAGELERRLPPDAWAPAVDGALLAALEGAACEAEYAAFLAQLGRLVEARLEEE